MIYDFRHFLQQNRLIREKIPEDEYSIDDLIREFDMEYAAVNLDTMNKEGHGNNRRLINTSIVESTSKNIEARPQDRGGGILGFFTRK